MTIDPDFFRSVLGRNSIFFDNMKILQLNFFKEINF